MCEGGYDAACGPSTAVGENIAAGQWTAVEVFEAWRGSPGHNRNMLDPAFRVVGIGRHEAPGSRYRVFWVNTFGGAPTDQTVDPALPPTEEPPIGMPGTGNGEEVPPVVNPPPSPEEPPPGGTPAVPSAEPGAAPETEGFDLHGACTVNLASGGDPEPWLAVVVVGLLMVRRRR
jgi:MYXO-CTERM domain-containing protein